MGNKQQRAKLKAAPLPAYWGRRLERHLPIYARLSEEDRKELHGHIQVFLAEKRFERFFAVATESFFERPSEMWERHAELYEQLKRFYRQDPASLPSAAPSSR